MSWEPWHVQLEGTRDMPEEPPDTRGMDVSEAELEQHGVTMEDVDASIDDLLQQIDRPNDEVSEADEESADEGYDPEAAQTRSPEGASR
jgi:hypothetical protein